MASRAMVYLTGANQVTEESLVHPSIDAAGTVAVIIGDDVAGADWLGTAPRNRARWVYQLEILPEPPIVRSEEDPWPTWPRTLRTNRPIRTVASDCSRYRPSSWSATTPGGFGRASRAGVRHHLDHRTRYAGPEASVILELCCELVLLVFGFVGIEPQGAVTHLGLALTG